MAYPGGRLVDYALEPPKERDPGPTHAAPTRPDGHRVEIIRDDHGRAALRVSAPPPTAQVLHVDVGWLGMTVRGRLLGAAPGEAQAELAPRDGGPPRPLPTTWHGPDFTTTLAGDPLPTAVWDLRLGDLRMGRLLTDVTSPHKVFRLPDRLLITPDGSQLRIAPYYTPTGRLALITEALPCGAFRGMTPGPPAGQARRPTQAQRH